jgi:5-dehydro-4-deoxyglucarate dehydratase
LAESPTELRTSLRGLLAFPLTPFASDGSLAVDGLREHVELLVETECAAVFVACGTGEFFSLAPTEYEEVVRACVQQVDGRVPVVAGTGYGTRLACEYARAAEACGADALLLLPPYLTECPQAGLADHCLAVAAATGLGVILYQRSTALFEPETVDRIVSTAPNVIGFKEGVGEVDRLLRIRGRIGDRLLYLNGMPTAEVYAQSLAHAGFHCYSSALLTFMPEIATAFYQAFTAGDEEQMADLLGRAILPFTAIRAREKGYAVSLVKAGARLRGVPVGPVRSPLRDPAQQDQDDLRALLDDLACTAPLVGASV